jgi:hypothetical protein
MDPSIAAADIEYRDACGQAATAPIHEALQQQFKKRLAQVFERVQGEAGSQGGSPDGVVEVALGFREVSLFVPRKANKSYPATVTLGVDFSYTDQQGAVLHSKKLQSSATGEVEGRADSCHISNIEAVAQAAITNVVAGVAQQLGTATRIREQAQFRKTSRGAVPSLASQPAVSPDGASLGTPVSPGAVSPGMAEPPGARQSPLAPSVPPSADRVSTPTKLSFRTIIRDENQNHVLEQHENFSVEFEVRNEGTGVAEAVEIDLSGHVAIVGGLKTPVFLGVLQPGEVRRVAVDGKVGAISEAEQAELICAMRASSNVELPSSKKFFVAIRPERSDTVEVLSVDVDELPKANGKRVQSNAIGVAIGVGTFRDSTMRGVKFAAHDAEIMGRYFERVLGIPLQRVKVVIDNHALKDDLIEVFEQWLPKQGGMRATAYIYVSGRAVVDQETGIVSLLPYDGTVAGASRAFSLTRLQRALAKASVKRAVLMMDLSLEPSSGADPGRLIPPRWTGVDSNGESDRLMQMIGNSGLQEAQAYQPGQHGLFTYFLLKGLRGSADLDKNGTVLSGELCAYVHGQVASIARSATSHTQQPICIPEAGRASPMRAIPLSISR